MEKSGRKTIEEHREYVCELAKFSFFHAYRIFVNDNENRAGIDKIIQTFTPFSTIHCDFRRKVSCKPFIRKKTW